MPTPSRGRVLGPRSSLLSHVFPPFYACYLLRSIQTPQSKAQHNGELKQGAFKTRFRRPWIMQMIVHGFPSRLAALQFEWAWQHPHKSRHLRDSNGDALFESRRPRHLKARVELVCQMISHHPYSTWPLHVKLFSDEAIEAWKAATRSSVSMPPGFTCSFETEGVDGKSGKVGSGRQGPINVKDEHFTSTYLAKNTALLAANPSLCCSVCKEEILNYTTDALSTALCPNTSCTAVSHLMCLSKKFLGTSMMLIPRGGTCPSCNTYILWGDIVRGSYRRLAGGITAESDAVEDDLFDAAEDGELYDSEPTPVKNKTKGKTKASALPVRKAHRKRGTAISSSEGEHFDFDTASSAAETPKKRRGRPPKKSSQTVDAPVSSIAEDDLFDSDSSSVDSSRQKYSKKLPPASTLSSLQATSPRKRGRPPKNLSGASHYSTGAEFFDFGRVGERSSAEEDTVPGSSRQCWSNRPLRAAQRNPPPKPMFGQREADPNVMGLVKAMSSLTVSPLPVHKPRYTEISD